MRNRINYNPQSEQKNKDNANMHTPAGKALKFYMEKAGIGENELARATKLRQSTIHRILTGESKDPRIKNLQILADHFDVPVKQFIDKDAKLGSNATALTKRVFESRATEVAKISSIHNLNPEGKEIKKLVELALISDIDAETIVNHQLADFLEQKPGSDLRINAHQIVSTLDHSQLLLLHEIMEIHLIPVLTGKQDNPVSANGNIVKKKKKRSRAA